MKSLIGLRNSNCKVSEITSIAFKNRKISIFNYQLQDNVF